MNGFEGHSVSRASQALSMLRSVQSWSPASSSRACIARSLHRGNAERISASMLGHGLGCPADMAWSKFMLPTSLPVLSKAFFNFDTSFILSRGAHMHHSPNNCHSLRCWSFINIGNPYGAKLLPTDFIRKTMDFKMSYLLIKPCRSSVASLHSQSPVLLTDVTSWL